MIKLEESYISLGSQKCRYYIYNSANSLPFVVFLHGYSFTSDVWDEVGVLKKLEDEGIPFFAIDMPYGIKSKCEPKSADLLRNLTFLEEAISFLLPKDREVYLVGASMGALVAIKYAIEKSIAGMTLIGPVGTDDPFILERASKIRSPVLIIVGEKDAIIDLKAVKAFSEALPNSEVKVYEDAGHPAYLYKKEEFISDLISNYWKSVKKGGS